MQDKNDELLSLEDKRKLNLTASVRENIIVTLTKDGKIPQDKDSQTLLIKALDGLDNNTLNQAKLKVDKEKNDSNQGISDTITNFLLRYHGEPVKSEEINTQFELDNSHTLNDIVPGETDIGTMNLTIEEINKSVDP